MSITLGLATYTMEGKKVRLPIETNNAPQETQKETPSTGRQDYLLWELGQRAMAAGSAFCGTEGNA